MAKEGSSVGPLVVVTGADENYSIGLAVTVTSMLHHLGTDRNVDLHVLDGGITPQTRGRLLASWDDPRVNVHWHKIEMKDFGHLVIAGHLNHSTYLRLLIPSLLDSGVSKAIYLDSDLLVRRDLGVLWDEPMNGNSVLAGAEISTPYVDSEIVFATEPRKFSKLGTTRPIANYRELGFSPQAKVFNAGILVIDVDHWRRENVPHAVYQCLEEHREHVLFCDQYALNVVLHRQWGELDSRWNQNSHFYTYKRCRDSPLDQTTFDALQDPWICHFTWIHKPWFSDCDHPFASEFVNHMRRSAWIDHQLQPNPAINRVGELEHPTQIEQSKRTWRQWMDRRRNRIIKRLEKLGVKNPSSQHRQSA